MKKFLVCLMLVLSIVTLTACQDASMRTLSKVNTTIDKVQNLVESMDTISNDILLIDNIMDEDNTGTGYDGATFTSGSYVMDSFINNILKLSNEAHNAIDLNNDTNDILLEIDANMDDIRTISKLIDSNKSKLSNDTNNSIDDICNNILMNVNRLMITRDDVTNELNSTLSLKRNYTRNVEQLTSKYTRLCSSLQTKNTYLENINNSMNSLYDTLYYIYRPSGEAESVSKSFSNIDTYKNATNNYKNKQDRKNTQNNENANNYGYGYGYNGAGYGMNNPYYGYGGYMGGRGFGGYGYGGYPYSPYGRYNPYLPNIDTFGTYRNIDTYKPYNDEEDDDENNYDIEYEKPRIERVKKEKWTL